MFPDKDKFVENAFKSIGNVKKTAPKDELFFELQYKISNVSFFSKRQIVLVAASIVIVFSINLFSILESKKNDFTESYEQISENQLY